MVSPELVTAMPRNVPAAASFAFAELILSQSDMPGLAAALNQGRFPCWISLICRAY